MDTRNIGRLNLCETVQQEISEVNAIELPDEILKVHGNVPPPKAGGTIRLIYENINGFPNRLSDKEKIGKARDLHDELEVDIAAYCEHRLNMRHKKNHNGFNLLFNGGEAAIRSMVGHNIHKNFGPTQQGGASLIMFGHLTDYIKSDESGKDETGLGRWVVMTLEGQGVKTRIICGYNPCGNNKPNSSTTYQQHRRFFITQQKDLSCPRVKFREDLVSQLKKWRESGDRLIVCMDANEDIYKKLIGRTLTDQTGLNMEEVVGTFTGRKLGPTFFRGSKPIDGIWATKDVMITHACVMLAGFGMGDHRLFVVDINEGSIIGQAPFRILRQTSRRLNTKVSSGATRRYIEQLEKGIIQHQIFDCLQQIHHKFKNGKKSTTGPEQAG